MAALIVGALGGASRSELLGERYSPVPGVWDDEPVSPRVDDIARGSLRRGEPPEIRGSGYVVESLEAASWASDRSLSFRAGLLLAVNLGDDADTTGTMYGQIAGAYYGVEGIPAEWIERRTMREWIEELGRESAPRA